jgi:hypothetical protein
MVTILGVQVAYVWFIATPIVLSIIEQFSG